MISVVCPYISPGVYCNYTAVTHYHLEEGKFFFDPGFPILMLSQGVIPCSCHLWPALQHRLLLKVLHK